MEPNVVTAGAAVATAAGGIGLVLWRSSAGFSALKTQLREFRRFTSARLDKVEAKQDAFAEELREHNRVLAQMESCPALKRDLDGVERA